MNDYTVIITNTEIVYIKAESEEHAIAIVKAQLPPRSTADVQVAKEVVLDERKDN